jgi:hypothetical protein
MLGKCFVPSSLREDTIDEWLDEIETAADAGKPVLWRTVSILIRALPRVVARGWRPTRAGERRG